MSKNIPRLAGALTKGIPVGLIFLVIELISPLPYEPLLLTYALVVFMVTASMVSSIKEGLLLALGVMLAHGLGELAYYAYRFGPGVALGILGYTIILMLTYLPSGVGGAWLSTRGPTQKDGEGRLRSRF